MEGPLTWDDALRLAGMHPAHIRDSHERIRLATLRYNVIATWSKAPLTWENTADTGTAAAVRA